MRVLICLFSVVLACALAAGQDEAMTIKITSAAFENKQPIPLKHSAYGDNLSPALAWTNLPEGTKQIAIIMDDPIAPTPQPFVHWVIYNIPATAAGLPENLMKDAAVTTPDAVKGAIQGPTGVRRPGYFGPRPPKDDKVHEYHFTIYALDIETPLAEGLNKEALIEAMKDHTLAKGELIGTYKLEG